MAGLLLAIGGLQLYGQQRNKRERTEAEIRFTDLITENRKQSILITALIDQFRKQGVELRRIADGIAAAEAPTEKQRNARDIIKTETRFAEQTTRLTEQAAIVESGFAEQTTRLTEQAAIVESGFDDLNSRLLEILPIIVRITEEEKCKQGCGLTGLSACLERAQQGVE